jgi:ABC-2 type transport system permease protein
VMPGAQALMVAYRDLQRFWKYKWWLAGLITMNLADLFIFALVFKGIVRRDVVPDYFYFLAPGIASIAAFAAAFTIGREVMMELRRGFHHYLLSLPISRIDLVVGRILGGVVRGVVYQMPFIALLVILTGVLARFPEPLYTLIVNNPISIATSIYRAIFTPEIVHDAHQVEVLLAKLTLWTITLVVVGAILYDRNLKS